MMREYTEEKLTHAAKTMFQLRITFVGDVLGEIARTEHTFFRSLPKGCIAYATFNQKLYHYFEVGGLKGTETREFLMSGVF